MRETRRLYFNNTSKTDKYVALYDKGNGRLSTEVRAVTDPGATKSLQESSCFFKLFNGAFAMVDILIPSAGPQIFDAQVFRSRKLAVALGGGAQTDSSKKTADTEQSGPAILLVLTVD